VARYQAFLAEVLMMSGRVDEAEPLAREAVAIIRDRLPADHPDRAECETILGLCLVELERHQEAEPLLLNSYRVLKAKEPHRLRTRTDSTPYSRCTRLGQAGKAREWRAKLEAQESAAQQPQK